jgi:hypothetical protein
MKNKTLPADEELKALLKKKSRHYINSLDGDQKYRELIDIPTAIEMIKEFSDYNSMASDLIKDSLIKLNKMKTLEIALDNGVKHARYYTLNIPGTDDVFFEGYSTEEKYVRPLTHAKTWAAQHGYKKIELIGIRKGERDETYVLTDGDNWIKE